MTESYKVLLPILRRVISEMVASEIVGVQPMTSAFGDQTTTIGENEDKGVIVYWVKPPAENAFTLRPVYAGHQSKSQYQVHISWCNDTFSEIDDGIRWFAQNGTFYFYKEADRTTFLLRWGQK